MFPEDGSSMQAIIMENMEKMKEEAEKAKEAKAKAAAAPATPVGGDLKAIETFAMMGAFLDQGHGADIIKKVQAVFNFDVTLKKGAKPVATWELDLKNGKGSVKR